MLRLSFRPGIAFLDGVRRFVLRKRLFDGQLHFEADDGTTTNLTMEEVHRRWAPPSKWVIDQASLSRAANVVFIAIPALLTDYPERDQKTARRREQYLLKIEALVGEGSQSGEPPRLVSTPSWLDGFIRQVAASLKDPHPPSAASIWRWWSRYMPTRCATRLVDGKRSGRPTVGGADTRALFDEAVQEVYLTAQKLPRKPVYERLQELVRGFNSSHPGREPLNAPSKATFYRWIRDLYTPVVMASREGRRAAEKAFRSATTGPLVQRILDRWELDHTRVDVLVVCLDTNMLLGRPWITLCIDRKSRMIVGFYLSFHTPSATSVLQCLRMAIMPKEGILSQFPEVKNAWPARGIPKAIAVDNGMDLHARDFEEACQEIGVELHLMGAGYPELKGAIERCIGTVNRDLFHTLPGSTFANVQQRGDYPSESLAALDIRTLTRVLVAWIVGVYHNTPHRGLKGLTPLEAWREGEATRVIELPAYPRQLDLVVGHGAMRNIFHYGVQYDGLFYNSPELQTLVAHGVRQVRIRALEERVDFVMVRNPSTNEYFEVPAADTAYAASITRHAHRLVMQQVRERFANDATQEQRRRVKQEIQAMVAAAIAAKKAAGKKAAISTAATSAEVLYDHDAARKAYEKAVDVGESSRAVDGLLDEVGADDIPDYPSDTREVSRV